MAEQMKQFQLLRRQGAALRGFSFHTHGPAPQDVFRHAGLGTTLPAAGGSCFWWLSRGGAGRGGRAGNAAFGRRITSAAAAGGLCCMAHHVQTSALLGTVPH